LTSIISNIWMKRSWFAIHDSSPGGAIPTDMAGALELNNSKHGIFWTVNEFHNATRKIENLKTILSWAVDIDDGTKEEQQALIKKHLRPSLVVETKRGYQVYYDAQDAKPENYKKIVENLIFHLNGDKRAKDIARIMRVPFYLHWKNPDDPYFVTHHEPTGMKYTEEEMLKYFPGEIIIRSNEKVELKKELSFQKDSTLFEKIWSLDCKVALEKLSGTAAVGMETFDFKRTGRGFNLIINGKATSCWIDASGRIGSSDGGGPTIWQWVNWYHRDHKKTYSHLKQIMPEMFNGI